MRLCTFEELCPGGLGSTPVMGQSAGDQYVVYDCAASVGGCPSSCTQYDVIQIGTFTSYSLYPGAVPSGTAYTGYTCRSYHAPSSAGGLNQNAWNCQHSSWWGNNVNTYDWTRETVCC